MSLLILVIEEFPNLSFPRAVICPKCVCSNWHLLVSICSGHRVHRFSQSSHSCIHNRLRCIQPLLPWEVSLLRSLTTTHLSGPKQFEHNGHHYWFSGKEENFTDHKVDWLDGRNICREYCMDLVSLETPSENDLITKYLTDSKFKY